MNFKVRHFVFHVREKLTLVNRRTNIRQLGNVRDSKQNKKIEMTKTRRGGYSHGVEPFSTLV